VVDWYETRVSTYESPGGTFPCAAPNRAEPVHRRGISFRELCRLKSCPPLARRGIHPLLRDRRAKRARGRGRGESLSLFSSFKRRSLLCLRTGEVAEVILLAENSDAQRNPRLLPYLPPCRLFVYFVCTLYAYTPVFICHSYLQGTRIRSDNLLSV